MNHASRPRSCNARKSTASDLASSAKKVQKMIAKAAFLELLKGIKQNGGNSLRNFVKYKKTINRYHELGHTWTKRQHLTYQMEHHILLNGSFPKTCEVVATNVNLKTKIRLNANN
jgi:hypothetical protein